MYDLKTAFVILPNQLFEDVSPLKDVNKIFLVEEELFFNQFHFHKQKLVLHRASMKYYEDVLSGLNIPIAYIEARDKRSSIKNLLQSLSDEGFEQIVMYRPVDDWIEKRIQSKLKTVNLVVNYLDNPLFLENHTSVMEYFSGKTDFFQTNFYVQQRKKYAILLEDSGKPKGGKWSFDADNREKYPANKQAPKYLRFEENPYIQEARDYVVDHYIHCPGDLLGPITYPVTHQEAKIWLHDFLNNRFSEFGRYEDAIVMQSHVLNHSVITPALNIGLLTPLQVLESVLEYGEKFGIELNNIEGYVRQIIGWREFIRGVYVAEGVKQRTFNYWQFKRKIPQSFYNGTTGIVPVDVTIKKLLKTGYTHHIERLMVLSNFMLLCEFDPDEVYKWFMELYIDSYDWVMVPNVYGMGQFADGGMMCTKPYISGSNYIAKMSNYTKDTRWTDIWDALFWRFMHVHRDFFSQNPRLGMLLRTFDKMPEMKQQQHLEIAEKFLQQLDKKV